MKVPSERQIEAGEKVASELMDASIQKSFHGLGGCKEYNPDDFEYKDLVLAHVEGDLPAVACIFMAMMEHK